MIFNKIIQNTFYLCFLLLTSTAYAENKEMTYVGYYVVENNLKAHTYIKTKTIKKEGMQLYYDDLEFYEHDRPLGSLKAAYMLKHNSLNCFLDQHATIAVKVLDRNKKLLEEHDLRPVNLQPIKPSSIQAVEAKLLCSDISPEKKMEVKKKLEAVLDKNKEAIINK